MHTTRTIRITVRGRLSSRLAAAFDGMTPVRRHGATELVGDVADQAQLYGLLARIRDLGLDLESVAVVDPPGASVPSGRGRRRYARPMTGTPSTPTLVLGRDTCEDTVRSRALLERHRIPFTYLRVDEDADADAWVRRLNGGEWRTPTILLGDPERPDEILREPSDEELLAALGLR